MSAFMAEKSLVNDVAEIAVVGVVPPPVVVDVPVDDFFELPHAASKLPARTTDSPITQPDLRFNFPPWFRTRHQAGWRRSRGGFPCSLTPAWKKCV
ncbi:MAG: hypothetical protein ACRDZ8_14030 [Acidimicrobiales bacterium]